MKSCFILVLVAFTTALPATIRSVHNFPQGQGQYTSLQTAITEAVDGDTIYVYPSPYSYGDITVDKLLTIYGVGWTPALGDYPILYETQLDRATFITGSAGSHLTGLIVGGAYGITISTDNIHVSKCAPKGISIAGGLTSIVISQCLFSGDGLAYFDGVFDRNAYIINDPTSDLRIRNCVFWGTYYAITGGSSSATITNSIFNTNVAIGWSESVSVFRNNYVMNGSIGLPSAVPTSPMIQYNINSSQWWMSVDETNQGNIPFGDVFDESYHPIDGSPAIDAGDPNTIHNDVDGTRNDIGIYGGSTPFVENGMTNLPTIRAFGGTTVTSPSQGLDIHFRATSGR